MVKKGNRKEWKARYNRGKETQGNNGKKIKIKRKEEKGGNVKKEIRQEKGNEG